MTSSTKKQKSKIFQFLKNLNCKTSRVFRGFEQLSSSIGWRVMAFAQIGQVYTLWDLMFYQSFSFGAIILAPETLESRSKSLKTRIIA